MWGIEMSQFIINQKHHLGVGQKHHPKVGQENHSNCIGLVKINLF